MNRIAAPVIAGVVAGGIAFAAGMALSDDDEGGVTPATTSQAASAPASGQAVFVRMGCGGCHTLAAANSRGQVGPNLDERLPSYDRAALKAKITDPYPDRPVQGQEYVGNMPEDFGRRMTAAELDALVTFLLAARTE